MAAFSRDLCTISVSPGVVLKPSPLGPVHYILCNKRVMEGEPWDMKWGTLVNVGYSDKACMGRGCSWRTCYKHLLLMAKCATLKLSEVSM